MVLNILTIVLGILICNGLIITVTFRQCREADEKRKKEKAINDIEKCITEIEKGKLTNADEITAL